MEDWREEIWERANLFAAENGRSLIGQLGYGYDGNVFATERQSAIKVLHGNAFFESEYFVGCDKRSAGTPFLLRIGVPARCLSHPVMEGPVKRRARLWEKISDELLLHDRMAMAAGGVGGVERLLIRLLFAGRNRMT